MNNEATIDVLNTLIEINNDRIEGYKTAADETEETDLKNLFGDLKQTSEQCRSELVSEVHKLGGIPEDGTKTSGKFFRMWMDVKAAITGKDRKAILNSCEFGEDMAVDTYKKALSNHMHEISDDHHAMLSKQFLSIKADHDKIKSMRDMARNDS